MLLTRRMLTAIALALVFAVAAVLLGNWQYSRHEDRVAARDRVEAHYEGAPVPLAEALGPGAVLPQAREWTRVEARGEYAVDEQLYVRNRPHEGTFGYEVLVPLETPAGTVAVNRGWAPNAADASVLPEVPPAPAGEVVVTGWLRPGEVDLERDLPEGQLASINLDGAAQQWGREVLGAQLVLDTEEYAEGSGGAQIDRPVPQAHPDTGLGSHFAYALQWWGTAPVGLVLVVVMARRDYRDSLEADGLAQPKKPKKVRIWDEEDE